MRSGRQSEFLLDWLSWLCADKENLCPATAHFQLFFKSSFVVPNTVSTADPEEPLDLDQ